MKISLFGRASHHVIDAIVLTMGAGILLSGCFATKAQVIENDSPPPAVAEVAGVPQAIVPPQGTPPPLESFRKLKPTTGLTRFSVDTVHQPQSGDVVVAAGPPTVDLVGNSQTSITGWAVDFPAHRKAEAVYIMLDTKLVTSCPVALSRPDVASALQDQVFTISGFSCVIPANKMSRGPHKLSLGIVTQGRTYYVVHPATTYVVR